MDIIEAQKMHKTQTNSTSTAPVVPGNLCSDCYLPISDETEHKCVPAVLPSIEIVTSLSGKSEEEQAAKIVRQKLVSEASTSRGHKYGTVTLATCGQPIHVEVKRPKIEPQPIATVDHMIKQMQQQNCSLSQIEIDQKFVRKIFGTNSVEPHCREKVIDATHHLDKFFEVKVLEFKEKVGKTSKERTVEKPVVVVKDVNSLIRYLLEEMDLDEGKTLLKVGIDDGQGFLKFCLLIVNKHKNEAANSVKEVIILSAVPDVKESYENVYTLWKEVGINDIEGNVKLGADLKIYNIVLGIGTHSSSCPCYICDARDLVIIDHSFLILITFIPFLYFN